MNAEFTNRLNDLINEYAEGNLLEFSRLIDVTFTNIAAWQDGFEPRLSPLISIVKNLKDISPEWLITGEGPKYRLAAK